MRIILSHVNPKRVCSSIVTFKVCYVVSKSRKVVFWIYSCHKDACLLSLICYHCLKVINFPNDLVRNHNWLYQICVHPRCLYPDHRVHLSDRHFGRDAEKVPEPHFLHFVLPKPLHRVALGGHSCGLPGHAVVHRGAEQFADGATRTTGQREEGRVKEKVVITEKDYCMDLRDRSWQFNIRNTHILDTNTPFPVSLPPFPPYCLQMLYLFSREFLVCSGSFMFLLILKSDLKSRMWHCYRSNTF